jgi:hypothetical protein
MQARKTLPRFKSPKHKLISFFRSARDKWRQRSARYRRAALAKTITTRDLRRSRENWKQKYMRERERRLALEAQLAERPARAQKFSELMTASVSHPGG